MLCCLLSWLGTEWFYRYLSVLLHWHWGNHMIAPGQSYDCPSASEVTLKNITMYHMIPLWMLTQCKQNTLQSKSFPYSMGYTAYKALLCDITSYTTQGCLSITYMHVVADEYRQITMHPVMWLVVTIQYRMFLSNNRLSLWTLLKNAVWLLSFAIHCIYIYYIYICYDVRKPSSLLALCEGHP